MTVEIPLFLAFVSFVFVASITPGPNNLMVMASGAAFGWRRSIPHIAGIAVGAIAMLVAVNFGLGAIFERIPMIALILRFAGAIWLAWLACQLARPALFPAAEKQEVGTTSEADSQPFTLLQAALFQWVNPKTWSIMIAISSAYVDLAPTPTGRAVLMAGTFAVVAPVSNGAWLLAGQAIKRLLTGARTGRIALLMLALLVLVSAVLVAIG